MQDLYHQRYDYLNPQTPNRITWKASSLDLGATLSQLWATLGYGSLSFWATWLFR